MKRILLAGGGTAGHIMPLLAVKEALDELGEFEYLLIGSKINSVSIPCKNILVAKWRRYFSLWNFFDLLLIPLGLTQALWHIFWFMPNVCFSKGGYASVPSVLVSWLFRIPVVIHESDSIPGSANRFLARFAKKICLGYQSAKDYFSEGKTIFSGNPVRRTVFRERISGKKSVLLILGGSQGSDFINKMTVAILPELLREAQVIHQTGREKKARVDFPGYKQFEFIEDMGQAYSVADLVLTRGGANTLAELSALGKPSIIIPLSSSANDHQRENAYTFSQNQAAITLEEETLGPLTLLEKITTLLHEPETLKNMGMHAKELNPPDASQRVAKAVAFFVK